MGGVAKTVAAIGLAPVTGGASLALMAMKDPKVKGPSVPHAGKQPDTQMQAAQEASASAAARRAKSTGFKSTILSQLSGATPPLRETIGA